MLLLILDSDSSTSSTYILPFRKFLKKMAEYSAMSISTLRIKSFCFLKYLLDFDTIESEYSEDFLPGMNCKLELTSPAQK